MTPLAANMSRAGEIAGVSRWTIQGWIRQGLPFIQTGKRHKLIIVSEMEKWLKSRQTTARGAR